MDRPINEKAAAATPTAFQNRQTKTNKSAHEPQSNLDKSRLMSPAAMLDMQGIRYQREGSRFAVYCPFHKEGKEQNPSLMMNVRDGHYRCFTCGEKGGDVIAFYRALTGAGFVEALKVLGVHLD